MARKFFPIMQIPFSRIQRNPGGIQTTSPCRASLSTAAIIATLSLMSARPLCAQVEDKTATAERLAQLELDLSALRKAPAAKVTTEPWLTNKPAPQLALQAEVAAHSIHYRSLRGSATTGDRGGYAKQGYFLTSADGAFSLNVSFLLQVRHLLNQQDSQPGVDADESVSGFEQRRTRIYFTGQAGTADLEYKVVISFSSSTGSARLSDGWLKWHMDEQTSLQAGQFKAPFLHEEITSASRQLAVDRSYVNALMSVKRTQGLGLNHQANDQLRLAAMVNDGSMIDPAGGNGSNANTAFSSDGVEFAATARADWLVAGGWSQFKDYTAWSDDEFGLRIGAAAHWQRSEAGDASAETDVWLWTVDSSLEWPGLSFAGALVGGNFDTNATSTPTFNQLGGTVQAGYQVVPDQVEIFGRYEWFDFDGATAGSSAGDFRAVTAGLNWFILKHRQNAKFTTDVVWALDPVPDASSGVGLRADLPGNGDQFVVRSQLSLRW